MHHITRRRSSSLLLAGLVALLATCSLAGAASAAVPGLQLVTKATALDSSNGKSAFAFCPSGKSALGGGGRIIGGQGQVALDDMNPEAPIAVSATGREDADGFAGSWLAETSAICASPVPGLQVVSSTSPANSVDKGATAVCPAGKQLLGAGASIFSNAVGGVTLDDVIANGSSARVFAREMPGGTSVNWFVSARAVCADPLPGLQLVSATSPSDSFGAKSISATCPSGKKLLGGGGEITGGLGEVVLKDIHPNGGNLTAMVAAAEEVQGGSARSWNIRAFAVCATP